ncbi:MAG: hypothetical protein H7833_04465 [Magnetococcus sp. DMHC-1]|nr:hypothetical protein [Magnetococcales bacterium]
MDQQAVIDRIWATLAQITENQAKSEAEHVRIQKNLDDLTAKLRDLAESGKRLDAQMDRTDKQIGELGNRLGEYVESMVAPACETLFAERGIPVHEVSPNRLARRFGDSLELDLTVINDHLLVVVETKSKLSEKHIKKFLKKLPRVPLFFPTYAGMHIMGAVAAMVIPNQVAKLAMKSGLFVIAPSGDSVRLLNPMAFKPHVWNPVRR